MELCVRVVRAALLLAGLCRTSRGVLNSWSAEDLPALSRHARSILFTDSSTMGLFIALVVPVDLPNKNIVIGLKFEANYVLPSNSTELSQYGYARDEARSLRHLTRGVTYRMLRDKFDSYGHDGEECLLKTICESAVTPLKGTGMFGDIAHVIFSPSSSVDEDLGPQYELAESRGKSGEDCEALYEDCPISVMAFVSEIEE